MLVLFDVPAFEANQLIYKQAREVLQEESNVQPVVCFPSPPGHVKCSRAI